MHKSIIYMMIFRYKLAQGATELMQLAALVSAFKLVRSVQ